MEPQICGDLEEMRPYGGKRKAPLRRRAGLMYRATTSAARARPTQYATGAGQHYDGSAVVALA
jgi:hypothetical protein